MARRKNTYFDPNKEEAKRQREDAKDGTGSVRYIEVIGDPKEGKTVAFDEPKPTKSEGSRRRQNVDAPVGHSLKGLVFGITERPSWYLCIFLAIQQFFAMFGTLVAIVMHMAPFLCFHNDNDNVVSLSGLISTTFFCSGLATLLQSLIGVRLPVVYGASFTYVTPVMAILAAIKPCSTDVLTNSSAFYQNQTTEIPYVPEWMPKLQEIQGAILMASLIEILVGLSGVVGFILQWVGPLTLCSSMTLIGLQLFDIASKRASEQWWLALVTVILIAMFSQFTRNLAIPACRFRRGEGCTRETLPLFLILPIILAVLITWIIYLILQATETIPIKHTSECGNMTYFCDNVLYQAPWFRMPYPFQYGKPILSTTAVSGIFAGVIASVMESICDYYACARMSSAPSLPIHAINRGISVQGIGSLLFGMFGCPMGTVSYTENVGAIGTTKVASRRVIQITAGIMLLFGVLPRFSAVFVVIPDPIKGGLFIVLFGMVTGIGISNLQFVDLNSSRNLFILGFSLFFGVTLPKYVEHDKSAITVGE